MSGGEPAVLLSESKLTGEFSNTRSLILLHSQLYISRHGTGVPWSVFRGFLHLILLSLSYIMFLNTLPTFRLPTPPGDNGK